MLIIDMPPDKCLRCILRGTWLCKHWCADGERKQRNGWQEEFRKRKETEDDNI